MDLTITVADSAKLTGLQRATAAYNLMNPTSVKTDAEFLQWTIDNQLDEYARTLTKPVITKLEFLDRFTPEERIAIRNAAKTNPVIEDYLDILNNASEVNLLSGTTIGGANGLEAMGHIAQGRAAIILAL